MNAVRFAKFEDLISINKIYNKAVVETESTFHVKPLTLKDHENWFYGHKKLYNKVFVVEDPNDIIAFGSLSPWSSKEGYNQTVELSIYVDSKFHGNGIGDLLMDTMLEYGKEHKIKVIMSRIVNGSKPSANLHLKKKFELIGIQKFAGYKFSKWHDIHMYQYIFED